MFIKYIFDLTNLQIVACGCPGGKRGNADASTTLNDSTPITRALESTTAFGSLGFPILPTAVGARSTMTGMCYEHLHVHDAWYAGLPDALKLSRICASVCTAKPGAISSPINMGLKGSAFKSCRMRLKVCTATS